MDVMEEEVVEEGREDESRITLPASVFSYLDEDQMQRVSVVLELLSSTRCADLEVVVEPGGRQVVIVHKWSPPMLDPQRLLKGLKCSKGKQRFTGSHTKVVALGQVIHTMKYSHRRREVESVFRINLPHQVEENFCNKDGHDGVYPVKCDGGLYLWVEMLGVRSQYKSDISPPNIVPHSVLMLFDCCCFCSKFVLMLLISIN